MDRRAALWSANGTQGHKDMSPYENPSLHSAPKNSSGCVVLGKSLALGFEYTVAHFLPSRNFLIQPARLHTGKAHLWRLGFPFLIGVNIQLQESYPWPVWMGGYGQETVVLALPTSVGPTHVSSTPTMLEKVGWAEEWPSIV